jgi:transposase
MPMLAEPNEKIEDPPVLDAVVGGDTHRDTHRLEMLTGRGTLIATISVDNDADGYARAVAWIAEHAPGPRVLVGLEGTRSYGVGLARAVAAAGLDVVEVEQPQRAQRRGRGKSDPIDAHLAALTVLRMPADRKVLPRNDGDREAMRILLVARNEISTTRTAQINRIRALLLLGDDDDRALCRGPMSKDHLDQIARRRGRLNDTREQQVRRSEARRLAVAIRAADLELTENLKQLRTLVQAFAPGLLDRKGIGPFSGAQAIVSFSHVGRCRDDAAFAALAGASPLPASSGRTNRHRLNRGGDRQLNRALHTIMLTRWRDCPRTRAYIQRRQHQGMSDRDIRRCLKRYIARELFRALTAAGGCGHPPATVGTSE